MNEQINIKQLSCMCGLSLMALKIVSLPALMYELNKTDGLIVALTSLLIDYFFLFIILSFKQKFPEVKLATMINKCFGKILTKVIYILLFIFFFIKMIMLINESLAYFRDVIDEEIVVATFLVILLPVVNALCSNGLKNFARTIEVFFPLILIGFVICLLLAYSPLGTSRIGPTFVEPFANFLSAFFKSSFGYLDFVFVLVMYDKVKVTEKPLKRGLITSGTVLILLFALYFLFFQLYNITAPFHQNAIADMTQFNRNIGNVGDLDIISILVVLFSMFFQASIYFYCLKEMFNKIFNNKNLYKPIIIIDLLIIAFKWFVFTNLNITKDFIINYMCYYSILIWVTVPIFIISVYISIKRNKRNGISNQKMAKNQI